MNIFKVVNGQLFHIVKETVNTGSKKFFKIEFVFDNSWEDFNQLRFAEFYQNIDDTHIRVAIDENGIVEVPTDIICQDLPLYVGVSAENIEGTVIPNTNFLPIAVNYGANSTENIHYPETENNLYALFSPNTSLRYLRVNNGVLEYSNDNKQWFAVSGLVSGGISEEKVEEIVEEKTKNLPTTIDAQIEENTIHLTIELKDKNGNTVSSKTIQIPQQDLTEYVKFTDYATYTKAGVVKVHAGGVSGIDIDPNTHVLKIYPTTGFLIEYRHDAQFKGHKSPITPQQLDDAILFGLTTNQKTMTEEQQGKACDWVGAVKKDTSKPTNKSALARVYGIDKDGNQVILDCVSETSRSLGTRPNTIAMRDGDGNFEVALLPYFDNHATSKRYVEYYLPAHMSETNRARWREFLKLYTKEEVEDYHARNRNVYNITQIDPIYSSKDELPNLGADGNGTAYLVKNDTEKAIYSYDYSTESGTGIWTKKDDLKPHTVYVVLSGAEQGIYRYTMASPFLVPIAPTFTELNEVKRQVADLQTQINELKGI